MSNNEMSKSPQTKSKNFFFEKSRSLISKNVFDLEFSEWESSDRDDCSGDIFSFNQSSVLIYDIYDGD